MTNLDGGGGTQTVSLPRHQLLFMLLICAIVPFFARLLGVIGHGWEWLTDYLLGVRGLLFFGALNLIPVAVLYGLGKASKHRPFAFWFATIASFSFLIWSHGTIDIRGTSTAVLGLIFIPIYSAVAAVVGWMVGAGIHPFVKTEQVRVRTASIIAAVTLVLTAGSVVYETQTVGEREARFPVITANDMPLTKHEVYPCCSIGRVKVLMLGNFDAELGNDIAVLGASGVALLNSLNYEVKFKTAFAQENCDNCVHMHPYLVADGKGGLLVASSDGVSDDRGRLLWALKAKGFSRLVPIHVPPDDLTFLSYQVNDRADLHGADGKVLWSIKEPVSDVGVYVAADETRFPFVITGYEKSREFKLYDSSGNRKRIIHLPEWASEIESVAWPKLGHLLVGGGSWIGVLDPDGKEVLRHVIRGTSFNPYHGPEGTAVRLDPATGPYLAVLSHGSSGHPRSVLLIFSPDSRLVWQEEFNKAHTLIAVSRADGQGEALLVGGMDGVVEYRLTR